MDFFDSIGQKRLWRPFNRDVSSTSDSWRLCAPRKSAASGHKRTQTAFPITRRSGSPSIPHRLSQIKARITGARRASLRSAQAMLPSARTAARSSASGPRT